jgi:type II secretory pathway component PulK
MIFVTAIWVTIIIGAVVLVFARSMRVELTAAANRVSVDEADSIERGAEAYVAAQVDNTDGEADYLMNLPGEQCHLGNGYFWLLRPSANEQNYEFGITDEASKLNINSAVANQLTPGTPPTQLLLLPGITNQQADSIVDWIDTDTMNVTGGDGAESDYYQSLPEPYMAKNMPLDTVEELTLVQAVDSTLMFGIDRNHNGVIEPGEAASGSLGTDSNGDSSDRGIFPFITVYSADPQLTLDGSPQIVCTAANANNIQSKLTASPYNVDAGTARSIATAVQGGGAAGIKSIFQLVNRPGLAEATLGPIADKLTFTTPPRTSTTITGPEGATKSINGLINVNTAPREVLMTLTGVTTLTQNDIDNLISERDRADTSTIMWVYDALQAQKAAEIGPYITNRSYVYSADILAVSGDGRAFKRVRIVVDAQKSPPIIIYRKDLTSLGWPLPEAVRTSLRQGKGPGPSLVGGSGMGGLGGGLGR